jgi:hypothetical protein
MIELKCDICKSFIGSKERVFQNNKTLKNYNVVEIRGYLDGVEKRGYSEDDELGILYKEICKSCSEKIENFIKGINK